MPPAAGTYIPHIASVIHRESLALNALGDAAPLPAINLQSVLIGNGLSDPLIQFGTGVYDYAVRSPPLPHFPLARAQTDAAHLATDGSATRPRPSSRRTRPSAPTLRRRRPSARA